METYRIAELAERTGFSRPTLRYYEEIGLLDAPERSSAGYRVYDRHHEARLQFIRRAKRLGLSLDEIRGLVGVWAGGQCATTRQQLRSLVQDKITEVRGQIEDAATFLRQLEAVHDQLAELPEAHAASGCACAPELPHVSLVRLGRDLSLVETDGCACGGGCGADACGCGCSCCAGATSATSTTSTTSAT